VITNHVDIATARIEFENGAVANVTASRVSNKKLRRIRVFGDHQYYGLDYADQKLEVVHATPARAGPRAQMSPKRSLSRRVRRSTPSWIILSKLCAPEPRPWSMATSVWRHCALLSW
jgi:hypothetical protein